ncbi:MAG: phage portal protein [Treponemataceae bacterium]
MVGKTEKDILNFYVGDILGGRLSDVFNGDKFQDSIQFFKDYSYVDYFTLRQRSLRLFRENPYVMGFLTRVILNEIFTGLTPEPEPVASVLWGSGDDDKGQELASDYAQKMADHFSLYANAYDVFDHKKQATFGEFQWQVRLESLICGDGIIVSYINQKTNLPSWDWINGNHIKTPPDVKIAQGHTIKLGVELNTQSRHVAYWVQNVDAESNITYKRIPCVGSKSNRQIAWMVYGSDKFLDEVRGTPILALCLYMLKDLDAYKDAEIRAAHANALIPFIITTSETAPPTRDVLSINSGHRRPVEKAEEPPKDQTPLEGIGMKPGTAVELPAGKSITSFQSTRNNVNYAAFEESIISCISWAVFQVPPEIIMLKFQSSYSASRQANNEFDIYLKRRAVKNAKDICQIIFEEFITQSVLTNQLQLEGFFNDIYVEKSWQKRSAWLKCEWSSISRPSVDILKEANASKILLELGVTDFETVSRKHSGKSFKAIQLKLRKELKLMESLGFTSSIREDNNGRPAYSADQLGDEDE